MTLPRPSSTEAPLSAAADGVRVAVRVTPRAQGERVDGVATLSDGAAVLKVAVAAPPSEGRANEALLRLLATEWSLPRRDLTIVAGLKSRNKTVHVAGDPAILTQRLRSRIAAAARS